MNLATLSVEELRALETAWDQTGRASFRHRNDVRAELAAREGKAVEDLFPQQARYRTPRQQQHVDADRALRRAQARIVELEEQLALHGVPV